MNILTYICSFIVDRHSDFSHFLTVTEKFLNYFKWTYKYKYMFYPSIKLSYHKIYIHLLWLDIVKWFSRVFIIIYKPASSLNSYLYPWQHFVSSTYFNFYQSSSVVWYLIMGLICIFLWRSEKKHICMFLFFYLHSSIFPIWLGLFFLWVCRKYLYSLENNFSSVLYVVNISFWCVTYLLLYSYFDKCVLILFVLVDKFSKLV